jgi:cephalosporin hydroxylase
MALFRKRQDTANRNRYLDLVKDALLDLHYLENELRIGYLASLPAGADPDAEKLRDPVRAMEIPFKRLSQARTAGRSADNVASGAHTPYTDMGRAALDHLEASLVGVLETGVPGDVMECGVGRGGGGILLRAVLAAHEDTERTVWAVDEFLASEPDAPTDVHPFRIRQRGDLNQVRDGYFRFGLLDERVRFLQGAYDDVLIDAPVGDLALVRIGFDAAFRLESVLDEVLPRLSPGGVVIVEGTGRSGLDKRLQAYRELHEIDEYERVDWNTTAWRAGERMLEPERPSITDRALHRIPLAPPRTDEEIALSVVVVFYNMAREAARTLTSLSRSYQRGVEDLVYEVIVVDNGSDPDQRLSEADVRAHGPEFRLVTVEDAVASPTVALNLGVSRSRGAAVAVMIDGAHVLTPGVFRHALTALRTYEPAVVAVQHWYVGPGQQGDAQQAGYDQEIEDRLFSGISWPTDGYRLFEIGHFIGDRDWFDGITESNCLFVPRHLLEQVGAFDDSFDMAGGGYANLELFERLHAHPGVNPTSLLGEATFHQFHGGTTTNVADEAVRRDRVFSFGEHFRQVRGRSLVGLFKPVHYIGSMDTKASRRTRSRRQFKLSFEPMREPIASTEAAPVPVPEEMKLAALEAIWEHQAWREASWLGHRVARYPTDLHSYQELMVDVRPEVVLLLGEDEGLGGRALFAATVADQIGRGEVLAVGTGPGARPEHPRVSYIDGHADAADTTRTVLEAVGERPALVLLGLGGLPRVMSAFESYAPAVPVGGYVVVENTVLNGRPVAPGFGPGPHEAVNAILRSHRDFVPDVAYERYTLTFNKNGFLRRIEPA